MEISARCSVPYDSVRTRARSGCRQKTDTERITAIRKHHFQYRYDVLGRNSGLVLHCGLDEEMTGIMELVLVQTGRDRGL